MNMPTANKKQNSLTCLTKYVTGLGVAAALFSSNALAVDGGTFEYTLVPSQQHQYAGLMYAYEPALNGYLTCGATLVSDPLITAAGLDRRVVITARHCINGHFQTGDAVGGGDTISVTFVTQPHMVLGNGNRYPTSFNPAPTPAYQGKAFFTLEKGTVFGKNDIAVIVLTTPVSNDPVNGVPIVPQLPRIGFVDTLAKGSAMRMTGYGTLVWGNSQNTGLVAPSTGNNNILGPRDKMTITSKVDAVTNDKILNSMNFQKEETSACNGDSGSGWMIDGPVPTIVGTTLGGDAHCRAVNTISRLDTQDFQELLVRVLGLYANSTTTTGLYSSPW